VRRLHERLGATTIYITHDQEEAAAVSDRIAVMNSGRLQQLGTLLDLLDRPANRFVAEFIGNLPINILPAALGESGLHIGSTVLPLSPKQAARLRSEAVASLDVGVRPDDVSLVGDADAGALDGRVAVLEPQGDRTVVIADTAAGRVSAVAPSNLVPAPGEAVRLRFPPERAHVFAADGASLLHGTGSG
jgi:ABC-type sugar transport system ATPase subunit